MLAAHLFLAGTLITKAALRQLFLSGTGDGACCPDAPNYDFDCARVDVNRTAYTCAAIRARYEDSSCCGEGGDCVVDMSDCDMCDNGPAACASQTCPDYVVAHDIVNGTIESNIETITLTPGTAYTIASTMNASALHRLMLLHSPPHTNVSVEANGTVAKISFSNISASASMQSPTTVNAIELNYENVLESALCEGPSRRRLARSSARRQLTNCVDLNANCHAYVNECDGQHAQWMAEYCPLTCGYCPRCHCDERTSSEACLKYCAETQTISISLRVPFVDNGQPRFDGYNYKGPYIYTDIVAKRSKDDYDVMASTANFRQWREECTPQSSLFKTNVMGQVNREDGTYYGTYYTYNLVYYPPYDQGDTIAYYAIMSQFTDTITISAVPYSILRATQHGACKLEVLVDATNAFNAFEYDTAGNLLYNHILDLEMFIQLQVWRGDLYSKSSTMVPGGGVLTKLDSVSSHIASGHDATEMAMHMPAFAGLNNDSSIATSIPEWIHQIKHHNWFTFADGSNISFLDDIYWRLTNI